MRDRERVCGDDNPTEGVGLRIGRRANTKFGTLFFYRKTGLELVLGIQNQRGWCRTGEPPR